MILGKSKRLGVGVGAVELSLFQLAGTEQPGPHTFLCQMLSRSQLPPGSKLFAAPYAQFWEMGIDRAMGCTCLSIPWVHSWHCHGSGKMFGYSASSVVPQHTFCRVSLCVSASYCPTEAVHNLRIPVCFIGPVSNSTLYPFVGRCPPKSLTSWLFCLQNTFIM